MKADLAPVPRDLARREMPNRLHDGRELRVMSADTLFEFGEFCGEGPVIGKEATQLHERTHHMDAHFYRGFAVEDVGGLHGAVLGEGERQRAPATVSGACAKRSRARGLCS